jgi:hypothetical protein
MDEIALQPVVEIILAAAALALLGRDLYRAWMDKLRRPMTLVVAGLIVVLLAGTLGGRTHPSPWWLLVPGAILAWEVARGWRRTPRCHLWETGVAALAAAILLAALGLGIPGVGAMLIAAVAASVAGFALLALSRRREPRPWRAGDVAHYERRAAPRPPP